MTFVQNPTGDRNAAFSAFLSWGAVETNLHCPCLYLMWGPSYAISSLRPSHMGQVVSTAAGPGLILLREREDTGFSRHWESTIDNAVRVDGSSTPRGNRKRGEERVEGSRGAGLRTHSWVGGWWGELLLQILDNPCWEGKSPPGSPAP